MNQKEEILNVLRDRQWHHHIAISQIVRPGSVGMAIAQQISKLKKKDGHDIESRIVSGTRMCEYKLLRTAEEVKNNAPAPATV